MCQLVLHLAARFATCFGIQIREKRTDWNRIDERQSNSIEFEICPDEKNFQETIFSLTMIDWPRQVARALVSDSIEWNSIRRPKVFCVTDTILPSFLQFLSLQCSFSYSIFSSNLHALRSLFLPSRSLFYLPLALCLGICTAISSEQGLCAFSSIRELIGRQICLSIFSFSFEQWNWFRPTKVLQPLLLHWISFEYQCSSLLSSSLLAVIITIIINIWISSFANSALSRTREKDICIHTSYMHRHRRLDREKSTHFVYIAQQCQWEVIKHSSLTLFLSSLLPTSSAGSEHRMISLYVSSVRLE